VVVVAAVVGSRRGSEVQEAVEGSEAVPGAERGKARRSS
jgi:hypothetical protein